MFPDPSTADVNGIVCIGGELRVEILREAYRRGIFPWPHQGFPLLWFSPWERGVLNFDDLHLSRSLQRFLKKSKWTLRLNSDFAGVLRGCQRVPRKGQDGTWITEELFRAYLEFHRAGDVQSFEIFDGDRLVGGLYGVYSKGVMSAESMFFFESGASKVALVSTCRVLQTMGMKWMDVQMVNPLTESFGATEWSQSDFLREMTSVQQQNPLGAEEFRRNLKLFDGRDVAQFVSPVEI